jgi:GGDEF domain-containing protein
MARQRGAVLDALYALIGGDEFAVILPGVEGEAEMLAIAKISFLGCTTR